MDSIWKASILLFLLIQQYKLAEHITKQTQQDTSVLHSRAADHCTKQCPPIAGFGFIQPQSCYWVLPSGHCYHWRARRGTNRIPRIVLVSNVHVLGIV